MTLVSKPGGNSSIVGPKARAGVDTGYFWHWYTDFGHTNLGISKFNPY